MRLIIHAGRIHSKTDNDIHFITSMQLMDLYRIDKRKHEIIISNDYKLEGIHLEPLYHGDYYERSLGLGIIEESKELDEVLG